MSSSSMETPKFWLIAIMVLAISAAATAVTIPKLQASLRHQAAELVRAGNQTSGGEAEVDYRLAIWLNRSDTAAYLGLARTLIAGGKPDEALSALSHAGTNSQTEQLKVRTLIELGRNQSALAEAAQLTTPGRPESDILLAATTYALAGRPDDITPLTVRLSSPEALQRAKRLQGSKLTVAAELYAEGLLNSSERLLADQPTSYERNLLLAYVNFAHHSPPQLQRTVDLLTIAIALNPAALEPRQLLVRAYRDQGNSSAAGQQIDALAKLQSGRL